MSGPYVVDSGSNDAVYGVSRGIVSAGGGLAFSGDQSCVTFPTWSASNSAFSVVTQFTAPAAQTAYTDTVLWEMSPNARLHIRVNGTTATPTISYGGTTAQGAPIAPGASAKLAVVCTSPAACSIVQ